MNPRVLAWLKAVGLEVKDIAPTEGDTTRITLNGITLPWTIFYTEWSRAQWKAWAEGLGYHDDHGLKAYECALLDKHTDEEFDLWLQNGG